MRKKLLRGAAFLFLGQIGGTLAVVLGTPFLVRLLSKTEYGDFSFVLSVISAVTIVASLGIPDGLRKHVTEERDTPNWKKHVIGYYFRMGIFIALLVVICFLTAILLGVTDTFLEGRFTTYFLITAVIVFFKLLFNILRAVLMAHDDEHYSEALKTFIPVFYMSMGVGFLYLGYGVTEILFSYFMSLALVSVAGAYKVQNYIDPRHLFSPVPDDFPRLEMLSYNTHIYFHSLFSMTLLQVDIILVTILVGSEQTAIYKAALVATQFIWLAPLAIRTRLIYSTSELWTNDRIKEIQDLSEQTTRYILVITCLLAVGLATLAPQFILVYFGSDYLPAVTPMYLLLPGVVCFAIARPIFGIEYGSQSTRIPVVATATAAILNLILNLILIPRFGITGAAVATSIGYTMMLGFHLLTSRKLGFNPVMNVQVTHILLTTVITGIVLVLVQQLLANTYLQLAILPPVGFAVYLALVVKCGVIDRNEIRSAVTRGVKVVASYV